MMPTADVPHQLPDDVTEPWVERGGSSIIAPDSSYVVQPLFDREELIIADLDLAMVDRESMERAPVHLLRVLPTEKMKVQLIEYGPIANTQANLFGTQLTRSFSIRPSGRCSDGTGIRPLPE
jgi:hypothetical protein